MRSIPVVLSFLQRSLQVQGPFRSYSIGVTSREFEEIQVNVPWGHVAGKWYGPKDKRPIVGFHGWQDNAGTFDTLAPLLPSNVGFLAIDLPGHGLSSWLAEGYSYHSMDYIKIMFSLMREFKWEKISMICHSMSSVNGLTFTSLFPDKCDMFVSLDIMQPILGKQDITVNLMRDHIVAHNKEVEISIHKTDPPYYEMDELVEKLHKASGKSISKECCEFILKRSTKPSEEKPNKYYISRDGRLKSITFPVFPHDDLLVMAHRIKCPLLYIKAKRAKHFNNESELEEIMKAFKMNPDFERHLVDGTHHVHLNEPQKIAEIVNPFIKKYRPEYI